MLKDQEKVTDGAGGYDPGILIIDRTILLSRNQLRALKDAFPKEREAKRSNLE